LDQMCNVLGGIVVELVKGMVENVVLFTSKRRRVFTSAVARCRTRCAKLVIGHV